MADFTPGVLEWLEVVGRVSRISQADLAYAAGLIDGEGCITVVAPGIRPNGRSVGPRVRVIVYMTTPEVLVWLQRTFGGTFRPRKSRQPRQKPVYVWSIQGKRAGMMLEWLLPYFRVKTPQARVAIAFYRLQLPYRAGMKPRPGYHERLCVLKAEMLRLNQRGVA